MNKINNEILKMANYISIYIDKNYNKLIKENIEIFKNKIIEENKQKKVIIQRKNSIIKQTIKQYIESKKEFINNLCKKELNDQIKKKRNILKELNKLNNN